MLLDDDFGSIMRTVRLGRRIYDNLRKAMAYIIATLEFLKRFWRSRLVT